MFLPYCSRDCIQAIFSIDFNCLTPPIENKADMDNDLLNSKSWVNCWARYYICVGTHFTWLEG